MNRDKVKQLRERYPEGTRIQLASMDDPYAPVPPGTEGEVICVDDEGSIHAKWGNGSMLALIPGEDSFRVLPPRLTELKLYMPMTVDYFENEYEDGAVSAVWITGKSTAITRRRWTKARCSRQFWPLSVPR